MRPINCSPHTSLEPEFHRAFEVYFATGQDSPGFAAHVTVHPLREDEVIQAAKGFASELEQSDRPGLGRIIRLALPVEIQGIKPDTPEFHKFKQMKMEGAPWEPTLNIGLLGEAIAKVRAELRPNPDVRCENCGHTVNIPAGQSSALCVQCGQEITTSGEVLRIG